MTEYTFRREKVYPGDSVDVPDNAREIKYQHEGEMTIISWLEKEQTSVI